MLRAAGGAVAVDVPMSNWFVLVTVFGSLFIVTGKRYAELREIGEDAAAVRATLAPTPSGYLRLVLAVSCGAALVSYCQWAFETARRAGDDWPFYELSIVPMLTALLRYALVLEQGRGAAPEEVFAQRPRAAAARRWRGWSCSGWRCTSVTGARRSTTSLALAAGVDGWMTDDQGAPAARRRGPRARRAGGSSRSAASAVARRSCWRPPRPPASRSWPSTRTPATTAGPQEIDGYAAEAATDRDVFVRQPRPRPASPIGCATSAAFSDAAHGDVDDPIDVLYIDGAHRYAPARADIRDWGRAWPTAARC